MIACALFEPFALWHAVRVNPELKDKPLVTLKKSRVALVSRAASQVGIAVGMSQQGAYARCAFPWIVETDDLTLQNVWEEVLGELYSVTDRIESNSPGLVFLELSEHNADLLADSYEIRVGVGVSQEEAHLKALAQGNVDDAPVHVLEGVGLAPKNTGRLEWLGIKTLSQLRRWTKAQLGSYLGKEAELIARYLKGPFTTTVSRYIPAVILKEFYSFEDAVTEPYQILPVLEHLSNCLAAELGDRAAGRLSVTALASGIRFSSSRLSKESLHGDKLCSLARLALRDCGVLGLEVTGLSVELSGLYRPSQQGVLWQQRENVEKAREKVEARFPGALLRLETLNPYMPVGKLAYSYVSPGGERLERDRATRGRSQKRLPHQDQRQPSLAGD